MKMNITDTTTPLSIVCIKVERLFGRYSYVLPPEELNLSNHSPFILYGDNGSGKTTLLRLLFHLISPQRGHRFIANTPFVSFSVFLADGKHIKVSRQKGELVGSFKFQLLHKTEVVAEADIEHDSDNKLKVKQLASFYNKLSELHLNVFFIGDNRVVESDFFAEDGNMAETELFEEENTNVLFQRLLRQKEKPDFARDISLKKTIQRFEEWMRQQAIRASHLGTANVNSIYEDITARLVSIGESVEEDALYSSDKLIEDLDNLKNRSQVFSHFGLISPLDTQKLVNTLQKNHSNTLSMTWHVLKPYIDSVTTRLDALQEIKDLLTLFVEQVNRFFRDKTVQLHVQKGLKITITDNNNQTLVPEMLSSGEKQLLLLFCNTLTARDKATIFIIDEPEISLNIKWQRQLIRTLLNLTKNSQVQFLFATHSIELLSQYRSNVVKLSNV
jgi:ABC-type cobalamin/Fe3+-siderophores transport system ATPase subunit